MSDNKGTVNINISSITIIKIFLIIIFIYFLFFIKDIVAVLFVSLILASALEPWVAWMQKNKIPRTLGVSIIYLSLFLFIASAIYLIIPPIAEQIKQISDNFPFYYNKISSVFSHFTVFSSQETIINEAKKALANFSTDLQGTAGSVLSTVSSIFGSIFSFFLALVITFYMAVEENAVKKIVWSIAPEKHHPYIMQLVTRMQAKIGLWLRGQLILSLIIFALTFLGLEILHVNYALTLALIAGLTEFVPYLGPLLASIPAIFLAFAQSPMLAVFVIVLYYIIHLTESNIIAPKLMQKVVGLNPIVIIVVLLVGFKLAGVVGTILSIPVATATSVFLKDIFDRKQAVDG